MSELIPCPWCGGGDVVADRRPLSKLWAVYCRACEIAGPFGLSEAGVVDWWNTRPHHPSDSPARDRVLEALTPFAKIPLSYPRRGSQPQEAELDVPAPGGAYTAADVARARKLIR